MGKNLVWRHTTDTKRKEDRSGDVPDFFRLCDLFATPPIWLDRLTPWASLKLGQKANGVLSS